MNKKIGIWVAMIIVCLLLAACGEEKDFDVATWGMTESDVKELLKEKVTSVDTSDIEGGSGLVLGDIEVFGVHAEAHFSFRTEINKGQSTYIGDFFPAHEEKEREVYEDHNESWSIEKEEEAREKMDEFRREHREKMDDVFEKMSTLPAQIPLTESVLVAGHYFVGVLGDEEVKEMVDHMTKKYGNPDFELAEEGNYHYLWLTKRSVIEFKNQGFIHYYGRYNALEAYIK